MLRALHGLGALLLAGLVTLAIYNLKAAAARCDRVMQEQQVNN